MSRTVKRALFVYGLAVVVAVVALHSQATPALACDAVDAYDQARDCTFMEEYGECLWNAMDSLDTCLGAASGWFSSGACWVGYEIDFYACLPSEAIELMLPG